MDANLILPLVRGRQVIPDEAVEAAAKAIWDLDGVTVEFEWQRNMLARAALEAAAPHLMAAAWDQGYEKGLVGAVRIDSGPDVNPYRKAPDA